MICGGCKKTLREGDLYIEDTPSGYVDREEMDPALESLIVDIMTGNDGLDGGSPRLFFCREYHYQIYHGEDDD